MGVWLNAISLLNKVVDSMYGAAGMYAVSGSTSSYPVTVVLGKSIDQDNSNPFLFADITTSGLQFSPCIGDALTVNGAVYVVFQIDAGSPDSGTLRLRLHIR